MKLGKKLLSVLMTMVMVFALFVPAMAADGTADITIEGAGQSFYAWKVMDAEEFEGADGGKTYKYSVNPDYLQYLKMAIRNIDNTVDVSTENKVITYISGLDSDKIQKFADALYVELVDINPSGDYQSENSKFVNVDQGYYLIAEHQKANDADTISKVMLDTKGKEALTVKTKDGTVELEKKVGEVNEITGAINMQDGADYDFGDDVLFQLKGTLPANYAGFKEFHYHFMDTMAKGLAFDEESVEIYMTKEDVENIDDAENKTDITSAFDIVVVPQGDGKTFIEFNCEKLNEAVPGLTKDHIIYVKYTAELTPAAAVGAVGNQNKAYVKFSNNPYANSHGVTVEDIVIVFTYDYTVNKVDGAGDPLVGAGFTLYKQDASGEYVAVGNEVKGTDMTTFKFSGLDSGSYKLVETTVPGNYNKAEDIYFTLTGTFPTEGNPPKFTVLTVMPQYLPTTPRWL